MRTITLSDAQLELLLWVLDRDPSLYAADAAEIATRIRQQLPE